MFGVCIMGRSLAMFVLLIIVEIDMIYKSPHLGRSTTRYHPQTTDSCSLRANLSFDTPAIKSMECKEAAPQPRLGYCYVKQREDHCFREHKGDAAQEERPSSSSESGEVSTNRPSVKNKLRTQLLKPPNVKREDGKKPNKTITVSCPGELAHWALSIDNYRMIVPFMKCSTTHDMCFPFECMPVKQRILFNYPVVLVSSGPVPQNRSELKMKFENQSEPEPHAGPSEEMEDLPDVPQAAHSMIMGLPETLPVLDLEPHDLPQPDPLPVDQTVSVPFMQHQSPSEQHETNKLPKIEHAMVWKTSETGAPMILMITTACICGLANTQPEVTNIKPSSSKVISAH